MKRVIVTGASGFIGQALTTALLEKGTEVWAIVRNSESLAKIHSDGLHIVVAHFEDYHKLSDMITERNFDVFFHLAWEGYGVSTNDYVIQTRNILYSCAAAYAADALGARRFIFADSSHEFLTNKNKNGEVGYCSIYGTAKSCAQTMCRTITHNASIDFIGALFINIFGAGDKSSRSTNMMLRKMLRGEDLNLTDGDKMYNWTYIDDCVRGIIAAAEKGKKGKTYYVGGPLRKFSEIMTDVREAIGSNVALNFGTYPDDSEIDYSLIDMNALHNDTGFEPVVPFRDGILKTAEWLKCQ